MSFFAAMEARGAITVANPADGQVGIHSERNQTPS